MKFNERRVLIVEDNRAMAQVLRFNLERAGFVTRVAHDGSAAAKMLERETFDLLMTDLQMPVMDGAQLCHFVREELGQTDLPIVVCSAKGMENEVANLVVTCGVHKVFYKPLSPQAIVGYVSTALNSAPELSYSS